jgi:hypothetical protein
MLVTSASEIAVAGKPGITVAPAGAPASAVGVRTCVRKAAELEAVTGLHVCLLPATVAQVEPPLTYVKRFGTSGLPAVPNALWHPLQTRANEGGSAAPPPLVTHGGAEVAVPDSLPAPLDSAAVPVDAVVVPAVDPGLPLPLPTPPDEAPLCSTPRPAEEPDWADVLSPVPQAAARSAAATATEASIPRRSVRGEAETLRTDVKDFECPIKEFVIRK